MNANIRRLREARALSQRELAALAKLSVTTLNRIEAGRRKPMPKTVRKLAEALGVTPEELLAEQPRLIESSTPQQAGGRKAEIFMKGELRSMVWSILRLETCF